jgi:hypothetical protein
MDKRSDIKERKEDTVINALGLRIEYEKVQTLSIAVQASYQIGDCGNGPKNIANAIDTGYMYAMEI